MSENDQFEATERANPVGVLLDRTACERALAARDARFDGRFFTGVRSTGVYCRPICPARPKPQNCSFFPTAAAAQEAGYRPCLRCRPEAAPGTPAWRGTSATVSRALRLIEQGALDSSSVVDLAGRLGIGGRHLRRLFLEHLGAPPLAVAQTRRILFAKKLLDETDLPMAEVAIASGFASIRRFNDAIRRTYDMTPSALRRRRRGSSVPDLQLRLPYRAPYDWTRMLEYLALRATPGVEEVRDGCYRRSFAMGDARGIAEVACDAEQQQLVARLRLSGPAPLIEIADRLRQQFDLAADPREIGAQLGGDARLRSALRRRPGLRVPGAFEPFELAVRAILGQQVSVKGATTLAGRLAAAHGEPLAEAGLADDSLRFVFPPPLSLVDAEIEQIGLPGARAGAIRALARAVAEGGLQLDATGDLDETLGALRELPGIGEWTAQYIAMRALREPDAFPASDLGLRKALASGPELPSVRSVSEMSEAWRPCRAYAAVLLWSLDAAV